MMALTITPETEKRLTRVSQQTGVPVTECVSLALDEFLDEMSDAEIALSRLNDDSKWISSSEAKRALGL